MLPVCVVGQDEDRVPEPADSPMQAWTRTDSCMRSTMLCFLPLLWRKERQKVNLYANIDLQMITVVFNKQIGSYKV